MLVLNNILMEHWLFLVSHHVDTCLCHKLDILSGDTQWWGPVQDARLSVFMVRRVCGQTQLSFRPHSAFLVTWIHCSNHAFPKEIPGLPWSGSCSTGVGRGG